MHTFIIQWQLPSVEYWCISHESISSLGFVRVSSTMRGEGHGIVTFIRMIFGKTTYVQMAVGEMSRLLHPHLIPIISVEVKFIGTKKTEILIRAIKKIFLTENFGIFLRHASLKRCVVRKMLIFDFISMIVSLNERKKTFSLDRRCLCWDNVAFQDHQWN